MLSIKRLTPDEIKSLYNSRMKDDFPPGELRPYDSLIRLLEQGRYITLAYKSDGSESGGCKPDEIMAYAFFIYQPESRTVLLDYYAVSKARRGTGIGGEFISRFREIFAPMDADHILLEVENPDMAENSEDLEVRNRRIHFYEKNGCRMSHVRSRLLSVDYSIMYLPFDGRELENQQLFDEMESMYRMVVTPLMKGDTDFEHFVKLWLVLHPV